jgi:hypothetical protein
VILFTNLALRIEWVGFPVALIGQGSLVLIVAILMWSLYSKSQCDWLWITSTVSITVPLSFWLLEPVVFLVKLREFKVSPVWGFHIKLCLLLGKMRRKKRHPKNKVWVFTIIQEQYFAWVIFLYNLHSNLFNHSSPML